MFITQECIACGACLPECPEGTISEGNPYIIDAGHCTDCSACSEVCPVDACIILATAVGHEFRAQYGQP